MTVDRNPETTKVLVLDNEGKRELYFAVGTY